MENRHYLMECNTTPKMLKSFFSELSYLCKGIKIHNAGIGEFYLSITAEFSDDDLRADPTDVMHGYRAHVKKLKELSRKPSPSRYWVGEWEIIK